MKKLTSITLFSSLVFLLSTNVIAEMKGENPCEMTLKSLENNGYSKNNTYTPDDVRALLKRNNIELPKDAQLMDTQRYVLNYNCSIQNNLAHPQFTIMPTDTTISSPVIIATWEVTKPKQE